MREFQFQPQPDEIYDWVQKMKEWVKLETSLTIPQLCTHLDLVYPFMKFLAKYNSYFMQAFEHTRAILHNRWLMKALGASKLSRDESKVVHRYLRFYDAHTFDLECESKNEAAAAAAEASLVAELDLRAINFEDVELKEPYKEMYLKNKAKRDMPDANV